MKPTDIATEMTSKISDASIPNIGTEAAPWPCDWEGHKLQQLQRGAASSFRENLIWLEKATEFARKFARNGEE